MISVQEAVKHILSIRRDWGSEELPIDQATGRVLDQQILADRDMPPFDRVTMDGIAIRYEDYKNGCRKFKIGGMAPAGQPVIALTGSDSCIEVMTGAIRPEHADTVIRYEDLAISEGSATILVDSVKEGSNVHRQGTDRKDGTLLINPPCVISAAEINTIASSGHARIRVKSVPKTAVISTGDELIPVDQIPLDHQIRRSNSHMINAALSSLGIGADLFHLKDEEQVIRHELTHIIRTYDLVILSGGVSAGKFDFIPKALVSLDIEEVFHKVKQRPGKPLWFGHKKEGPVVFGLPGNPVSTFVCVHRYVIPWVKEMWGLPTSQMTARLSEDVTFSKPLTYFAQVAIHYEDGRLMAKPVLGRGSGDLANLLYADAFMELPADQDQFVKGEAYPVFQWK